MNFRTKAMFCLSCATWIFILLTYFTATAKDDGSLSRPDFVLLCLPVAQHAVSTPSARPPRTATARTSRTCQHRRRGGSPHDGTQGSTSGKRWLTFHALILHIWHFPHSSFLRLRKNGLRIFHWHVIPQTDTRSPKYVFGRSRNQFSALYLNSRPKFPTRRVDGECQIAEPIL